MTCGVSYLSRLKYNRREREIILRLKTFIVSTHLNLHRVLSRKELFMKIVLAHVISKCLISKIDVKGTKK